jgi:DNA-binding transcriptional ArsR family regulator/uncharacterized protein YndB with AHSA1/START domain
LGNPHRRRILDLLAQGPATTGDLAARFENLSRYAVMQHLGVLVEANLVLVRRSGRERHNYANPIPLRRIYERWVSRHIDGIAAGMLALQRHVEEETMDDSAGRIIKIELETRIEAPRARVFEALTTGVDAWWPHRTREDARIVFEPRLGGLIYEDWGDGKGLVYGEIVAYDPPRFSKVRGPGGVGFGVTSLNRDELEEDGEGTIYRKMLQMWGDVPDEIADMYESGTQSVADALKAYVEGAAA